MVNLGRRPVLHPSHRLELFLHQPLAKDVISFQAECSLKFHEYRKVQRAVDYAPHPLVTRARDKAGPYLHCALILLINALRPIAMANSKIKIPYILGMSKVV